jgi:hypothetical protein
MNETVYFTPPTSSTVGDSIAYTEEFYLRLIFQNILLVAIYQWRSDPEQILKTFLEMIKVNGKSKFKHFLSDLGLRNTFAVSIFCTCLFFSIFVPLIMPIAFVLFWVSYSCDKFNLLYVYPLDFDSQVINRKTLVVYSILGVLLFQVGLIFTIST